MPTRKATRNTAQGSAPAAQTGTDRNPATETGAGSAPTENDPAMGVNPVEETPAQAGTSHAMLAEAAAAAAAVQTQADPSLAIASRRQATVDTVMTDATADRTEPSQTVDPAATTTDIRGVAQGVDNLRVDDANTAGRLTGEPTATTTTATGTTPALAPLDFMQQMQLLIREAVSSAVESTDKTAEERMLRAYRRTTENLSNEKRVRNAEVSENTSAKKARKFEGSNKRSPRPPKNEPSEGMSDTALAKRFSRCGKCGRYIEDAAERAQHASACKGEFDKRGSNLFPMRIGKIRRLVKIGKDDQVNVFNRNGGSKEKKKVSFAK